MKIILQRFVTHTIDSTGPYLIRHQIALTWQGRLVLVEIHRQDGRATGVAVLARDRLDVVNVYALIEKMKSKE